VHSVNQRLNPRHLCEPLGGTEGRLKRWVLRRPQKACGEEQARMPAGSEFHSEGAATLKQREAKVVMCGHEGPTTDWCWKSIDNVPGCGS